MSVVKNDLVGFAIADTAIALRRAYNGRASPRGLTQVQWRVIKHIDYMPGLHQVELAERLDMDPNTLCRILDRLEEANIVERRRVRNDRRAWQLWLAQGAAPVLEFLNELATELALEAFEGLDQSEIDALLATLQRIRLNLARPVKGAEVA